MNLTTTTRIKKASADPSMAEVLFSKAPSNNQTLQSLQSLPSDDVLVARSRAGDTAAFEQLQTNAKIAGARFPVGDFHALAGIQSVARGGPALTSPPPRPSPWGRTARTPSW